MIDGETGPSKGYGFITFSDPACVKKDLEQLTRFELKGRPVKVGNVPGCTDTLVLVHFWTMMNWKGLKLTWEQLVASC